MRHPADDAIPVIAITPALQAFIPGASYEAVLKRIRRLRKTLSGFVVHEMPTDDKLALFVLPSLFVDFVYWKLEVGFARKYVYLLPAVCSWGDAVLKMTQLWETTSYTFPALNLCMDPNHAEGVERVLADYLQRTIEDELSFFNVQTQPFVFVNLELFFLHSRKVKKQAARKACKKLTTALRRFVSQHNGVYVTTPSALIKHMVWHRIYEDRVPFDAKGLRLLLAFPARARVVPAPA